ncbi:hypothetical protein [Levilactobacillus brevis]|uniref:hypothetical protein n=1 Tax=Levilactobacillus brevis TaxID=1580 RepID=UPI0015C4F9FC|nr:hypothetical protein [Levilactobacillus brevis]
MATPNVGILTTAGKALIDKVNSGQAKISFSKIVFSSMDNSQLSDMQVKSLTAIAPQEVVVSSPETTLDTNSGETRIRATGTNEKLADGVYVKTYGVFAKDDTGSEILYGVTVSPNPNYFPAYDGVTPQAVTYSYKTVIQETSNITMTNSNDVYASQEDLTEAIQPYAKTVDVNQQLDKKVNVSDMRKPASDVAGIEEVNAKQDKIGYTPADDSKVAHLSGANNFDTVPTVKNNPLLLASSLPSDLARTSQQTNFTAGLKSGGVDVATAADIKSIEDSAWRVLDFKNIVNDQGVTPSIDNASVFLYKLDETNKRIYMLFTLSGTFPATSNLYFNFSNVVKNISFPTFKKYGFYINIPGYSSYAANDIKNNKLHISIPDVASGIASLRSEYIDNSWHYLPCFVTYDELV